MAGNASYRYQQFTLIDGDPPLQVLNGNTYRRAIIFATHGVLECRFGTSPGDPPLGTIVSLPTGQMVQLHYDKLGPLITESWYAQVVSGTAIIVVTEVFYTAGTF